MTKLDSVVPDEVEKNLLRFCVSPQNFRSIVGNAKKESFVAAHFTSCGKNIHAQTAATVGRKKERSAIVNN